MSRSLFSSVSRIEEELESSQSGKVCVIIAGISRGLGIFLIDLAADTNPDEEFVIETCPNLWLPYCYSRLCVIDAVLYVFYTRWKSPPEVYSYELSPAVSKLSDVVLERSMMQKASGADTLSPKFAPRAVRYYRISDGKSRILWFSADIMFFCDRDVGLGSEIIDFELYDPNSGTSRKLPPLRVCRTRRPYLQLKLFHPQSSPPRWEEFSVSPSYCNRPQSNPCFNIFSFGFKGSTFLIQTNLGRMFSLDLECPDAEWRLCEEGIGFSCNHLNIMTSNGLCIDAFGVTDLKRRENEVGRKIRFPVSDIRGSHTRAGGPYSRGIALLDDYPGHTCTPVIGQVALDSYCGFTRAKLYLFIDVLKVDLQKYPVEVNSEEEGAHDMQKYLFEVDGEGENDMLNYPVEEDDEEDDDKVVECIKTLKFCLKEEYWACSVQIGGMFPY